MLDVTNPALICAMGSLRLSGLTLARLLSSGSSGPIVVYLVCALAYPAIPLIGPAITHISAIVGVSLDGC